MRIYIYIYIYISSLSRSLSLYIYTCIGDMTQHVKTSRNTTSPASS